MQKGKTMNRFFTDPRFAGIKPFEKKIWLASPTMHEEEQKWINDAFETGWAQINGRDELEIPVKAQLDGEYVRNMGLGMDLKCFFGSIGVFGGDKSVVEGGTGEIQKREKENE